MINLTFVGKIKNYVDVICTFIMRRTLKHNNLDVCVPARTVQQKERFISFYIEVFSKVDILHQLVHIYIRG